ncbi:MAG TPA: hypothetical protein VFZ11_09985 [Gemmatimonadaceae bacterium]
MNGITGTEWAVILGGIAAIGWVNWYFFLAQRTARPAKTRAVRKQ